MSQNRRPVNRVAPRRRPKVAGSAARSAQPAASVVEVEDAAGEKAARRRLRVARPSFTAVPWPWSGRLGEGWAPTVVPAVVAVVLAGFAALAAFRPGAAPGNIAYVDGAATEQVKAAARQALTTVYGYDATTIDSWPAKVHTVLTGDMARDFDKTARTTVNAVKQSDTKTDVRIDPIGVTLLDAGQAEVLADVSVSASRDKIATGSVAGPIVLRMTKVDGHWLASHVASTYMVGQ